MTSKYTKAISEQVQQINDTATGEYVDVIVQMESNRRQIRGLSKAASIALSRRRMASTPRDILPSSYDSALSQQLKQSSASTRTLLGKSKATAEAITLAKIQKNGLRSITPMLKSNIIRTAVGRMGEPSKKSTHAKAEPIQFWTSRSMYLRLTKEELQGLPNEIGDIRSLHVNRKLTVPPMKSVKQAQIESEDRLSTAWGLLKTNALATWGAYGGEGQDILVGLLDTGVDPEHPDLEGKIAHWAEFDMFGEQIDTGPRDSDEHGTHCAGTIVGGDNSGRWIGMAPQAKLAAALVLDGEIGGTDAQVLAGIDWAVERGVDVISMSLGGLVMDAETPPTYTEAILSCIIAGIPVIAAIGNEGEQTTGSPGNDLFALSIGATDNRDRTAGFSGGRTQIIRQSDFIDDNVLPLAYSKPDLSAPGVAIFSSVPGGDWKVFSGTSMATPHVAGAIALLLSATKIKEMESGEQKTFLIQDLITGSVDDIGESGQDHRFGFGRLDVLRAVDSAYKRGYGFE